MSNGILVSADIITYVDSLATLLKNVAPDLGLNLTSAPYSETTTGAYLAAQALNKIAGDGGSNPGLGYPLLQAEMQRNLTSLFNRMRWDEVFSKGDLVQLVSLLDNMITGNLPTGWTLTDNTVIHAFDAWLMRLNGTGWNSATLNGTPAAGSTAAANNASGGLPVTSGDMPWIVHTFVGNSDRKESLPSTPVQGAAIGNAHNALTYTIGTPASPPSEATKIKIYRTKYGGSNAGPFFHEADFTITSGYPTMIVRKPDGLLREDINPPSWLGTLVPYEFALLWALCFSSAGNVASPLRKFQSTHLLSPQNVFGVPASQLLHGNIPQHGYYGTWDASGPTWTAGNPRFANDYTNNALGMAGGVGTGSTGLQARVTSAINTAGTLTISYTYLDASLGFYGTPASATGLVSDAFSGTAVGSIANFDVPAGRLVLTVTVTADSLTSGICVVEAAPPRSY